MKEEYNDEPVFYCTNCLSLSIANYSKAIPCYCSKCTSTNIEQTSIDDWEKLYEERYGKKYLLEKSNRKLKFT